MDATCHTAFVRPNQRLVKGGSKARSNSLRTGLLVVAAFLALSSPAIAQSLTPANLSFGNQVVGQTSAPKTATFKNNTGAPVRINDVMIVGGNAGDFALTSNCPINPATLASGVSCTVNVTLTPSVMQARSATLRIRHNAPASPQTVGLSGTGIAPVTLSPATLSFANTRVGAVSASKDVTLTNKQNITLNFTSVTTTADFTIVSNTCGSAIGAGASCVVTLGFAPLATGSRTGTLTFTNSASNSPQVVPLSGTGTAPITQSKTALTFSARSIGTTSSAQNVNITNQLSTPVTLSVGVTGTFAVASNGCGTTLAGGATCTIGVTFTPTAVGAAAGILTVTHSAFGTPALVSLSGEGNTNNLQSLTVTPLNSSIAAGLTRQFTATGTFTNPARSVNLTSSVTWTSNTPAVATVSNTAATKGLATGVSAGTTTIRAALSGLNNSTVLTVTPVELLSIAVAPTAPSIALGTSQQFTATGTYTNGSTLDITPSVAWTSSVPTIANVSAAGLATSAQVGSTVIAATSGAISGSATLTVTPATLVSISVTPVAPAVAKGLRQQFTASGLFTDGSTQDLTPSAAWSSSADAVATIDAAGLATGVNTGTATISAAVGAVVGQTSMTVGPAVLVSIAVTPAEASVALGTIQQYGATGTYSDGSTQDLTSSVTWSSSAISVATIENAGLAFSTGAGTTTISATSGTIVGSTNLTVTPAAIVTIAVTPAIPSVPLGLTRQFTATGTFTDGSIQDVTNAVSWSSSDASVATISMSADTKGLASSLSVGATTIAATLGGVSGNTTLTVTSATIVSITVTPATLSLVKGTTQQFAASATYSDGTTQDVTSTAAWSSSDASVVTVNATGLATGIGVGSATVSAVQDLVTGSASVQATPATLMAIDVTPVSATIPAGTTQQFTATGTFTDGSTQDVTSTVQWSTSDALVVTVSNAPATAGLATGLDVGTVAVTAAAGQILATASLTVSPAALVSIAVTPATATIALGRAHQFVAIGTYTDATTKDITTTVVWSTSLATVAVVSNALGSEGLAVSAGLGTATITATDQSISGAATLIVGEPEVVSIAVTPSALTISAGHTQQFSATATYTDGSTGNVTASVTWSSSSDAVATVDAAGTTTAVAAGSATITATSGSVMGTADLVVVAAPSILSFTASPGTITAGTSSSLTPTFTGGTGVINPGNITVTNGEAISVSPASPTTYTLTVTNAAATSVTSSVTVTVVAAPSISSFSATPSSIKQGSSSSLRGIFANGTGSIDNGVGAVTSNVSKVVTPTATTDYTLTVANAAGTPVSATVTVTVHTLQSIAIVPTSATIPVGSQGLLSAVGTYSDGSTANLSNQVTWSSSDTAVATVNAVGLVTGVGPGPATITATLGAVRGTATVTVTAVSGGGAARFVYGVMAGG